MVGPSLSLPGEFYANGFSIDLRHSEGGISMARAQHPDSSVPQFFIRHKTIANLDGPYSAFGTVIEGMDVVISIAESPTGLY